VIHSLDNILWQQSPQKVKVLLDCRLKNLIIIIYITEVITFNFLAIASDFSSLLEFKDQPDGATVVAKMPPARQALVKSHGTRITRSCASANW
jgi:hypothetical protein